MIERAVSTYGRLDAAFNNAGMNSEAAALLETSDNEFERVMNVNLRGVWNCMKANFARWWRRAVVRSSIVLRSAA